VLAHWARRELESDVNTQNRTADGRIATKKEAMRTDCIEMVARYRVQAKQALKEGKSDVARALVNKCSELRRAFFADFGEHA
jgi:hypothetical protein